MEFYPVLSTPLSAYTLVRWLVAVLTGAVLIIVFMQRRHFFLKPSLQLLSFHHLLFQWPAAIYSGYLEHKLAQPWVLSWVLDAYVGLSLCITLAIQHTETKRIFRDVTCWRQLGRSGWPSPRVLVALGSVVAAVAAWYLSAVPLSSTGLYAVFFDPIRAAMAREESLKLLESRFVAYSFSILSSAVVPLTVLLMLEGVSDSRWKRPWILALAVVGIAVLAFCVMLPGSRYALVRLMLGCLLWQWFRSGMKLRARYVFFCAAALAPAVVFSILRESGDLSFFLSFFGGLLVHRVWVMPLEVGTWYLDHVHWNGFFGITGFPKLAEVFGVQPIDVQNLIGVTYASPSLATISAGAGFIFSYYAYLGPLSMPLCVLLTIALDSTLPIVRTLNRRWLAPLIAVISLALLSMVQGDYTVGLFTHGLLPAVFLSWALQRIDRPAHTAPRLLQRQLYNGMQA